MAIRRFRHHVAEQNWFSVGIDVLIVLLGVFLGLQADNWNVNRLERQRGEQYRQRLIDDLDANEQDFRQRAAYYRQVHDFGYAALQDLRRPSDNDPVTFLNRAFKASYILPRSTRRATYDEIVSIGAMGSVGDEAVRQKIMIYYSTLGMTEALIATLPPYRERLRSIMPYEAQQSIIVDCPEINLKDRQGRPGISLNASCRPKLDATTATLAASRIRSAPGIELELTRLLADHQAKIIQFETMQREAAELRAMLEATLRH